MLVALSAQITTRSLLLVLESDEYRFNPLFDARIESLAVTATHCMLTSERMRQMQQQISFVTLGIAELDRSRRFYVEGFGWSPVFENEEIIFYQVAGFVLGTFLKHALSVHLSNDQRPFERSSSKLSSTSKQSSSRCGAGRCWIDQCHRRWMHPATALSS
jgi:hypothetical protein